MKKTYKNETTNNTVGLPTYNATRPIIVEIVNISNHPIPEKVMEEIKTLRVSIEYERPGIRFNFYVQRLGEDKWDVKIKFDNGLPAKNKTILIG